MYRKLKAGQLFTGTEMLGSNKVLVIKSDGEIESVIDDKNAGEDVEIFQGILSPGFINAHCHLELSHMKGLIPEHTGLVDFVYKVVNKRHFADDEILSAIEIAEDEMLSNGIVAVGDICNNLLTLPQKLKQRLAYYNLIEASGWLPDVASPRFSRCKMFYEDFSKHFFETSIVPHAPYSVSDDLWQLIAPYYQNKVVSIHNQETSFEDELFLQGTGDLVRMYELMKIENTHYKPSKKSSLQTYFQKLSKAASIILVHNTFIKQEDIDFVKLQTTNPVRPGHPGGYKLQTFFCICINANQYIENAVPPINMLMKSNCNLILGTDSIAGNYSLNLLDEMKTIQKKFPNISLGTMLQWSTINGAMALQMDKTFGSFEKGKKPGIVLIEKTEGLKLSPASTSKRII
ncbi:MAG TPA: amidohydrolase family protein [Chitinophagaceae bacterium]|nr:amidohydrolase family protein [Chitinophagaceae bacterium]